MFDSVLQTEAQGQQRALGGGVSVLLHALVIGVVIYISSRPKPVVEVPKAVPVAFVARAPTALPPPPPPPPPAAHKSTPHPHKVTPVIKPVELVVPKEIPKDKPPEKTPDPNPDPEPEAPSTPEDNGGQEGGVVGGVKGGVVGGVKGGVIGGVVGNPLGGGGDEAVLFGEGMTKPVFLASDTPSFRWPADALMAKVEGLILAQCVVTATGTLRDCKILKRLPHIEDAQVLEWLAQWKMKPAMQGDRPLTIKSYTIPIRLKLP